MLRVRAKKEEKQGAAVLVGGVRSIFSNKVRFRPLGQSIRRIDPTTLLLETYWSSAGNGKPPSAGPV